MLSVTADGKPIPQNGKGTGTKFQIHLNSQDYWTIYTSSPITLNNAGSSLFADSAFTGMVQLARTGDEAHGDEVAVFDQHSGTYATGAEIDYAFQGDSATYSFSFMTKTQNGNPLLMFAMPHHKDILGTASPVSLQPRTTVKGKVTAFSGDRWDLKQPLTTIGFEAPTPIPADKLDAVKSAL